MEQNRVIVGIKLPYPLGEDEPSFYAFEDKESADEFIEKIEENYQGVEIISCNESDNEVAKWLQKNY